MTKKLKIMIISAVLICFVGTVVVFVESKNEKSDEKPGRECKKEIIKDKETGAEKQNCRPKVRKLNNDNIIEKCRKATYKKRSKTVYVFGIGMLLPVEVLESDGDESGIVKWKSYINSNDGSYLLIQKYSERKNTKELLNEIVDADGKVCRMTSSIIRIIFNGKIKGYEADYCLDDEDQHIITFNNKGETFAIIYNNLEAFGDIAASLAWKKK